MKLTLDQAPVVTVTGSAFFDVGHSLEDQKIKPEKAMLPAVPNGEFMQ